MPKVKIGSLPRYSLLLNSHEDARLVADFKHQYDLEYKPGGWHPVTLEPRQE
jgi:hypothetical protein